MIYLDNAAATKPDPRVLSAMRPYLEDDYGNAGAVHSMGIKARKAMEKAREQVADFIGADPGQIIFTSGGTEANNMVFAGVGSCLWGKGEDRFLISAAEHDSVTRAACSCPEFTTDVIEVNQLGKVSPSEIKSRLWRSHPRTGLLSVMYVNNETGAVNDVKEIGKICRECKVLFHTDCVQAAGSFPINVNDIDCDFLTISAHKIHGVKGAGALYARNKALLRPMIRGGGEQEFGLRGGTENVAGIVAFGEACGIAANEGERDMEYISALKWKFYSALRDKLSEKKLPGIASVNGVMARERGKILNIAFKGIDGETLLLMLDAAGVCVSAGSACRSREQEPSRALTAMGLSPEAARSSVRVSFSKFNTEKEIYRAAEIFADCAARLRGFSSQ